MPLAAVMTAPNQPVEVQQLPDPILEKGGIILETLYSEVCGTDIMSVYMPIIKLTQRRKGAKNLRTFYYGYATGHDMMYIYCMGV
jgi:threonine dehydrogenase-like Zn-dependent dehydrogenase